MEGSDPLQIENTLQMCNFYKVLYSQLQYNFLTRLVRTFRLKSQGHAWQRRMFWQLSCSSSHGCSLPLSICAPLPADFSVPKEISRNCTKLAKGDSDNGVCLVLPNMTQFSTIMDIVQGEFHLQTF